VAARVEAVGARVEDVAFIGHGVQINERISVILQEKHNAKKRKILTI